MRIAIGDPDATAIVDRRAVRIEDHSLSVGEEKATVRRKYDDRNRASAQDVHSGFGIDRDLADTGGGELLGEPPEVSLDGVAHPGQNDEPGCRRGAGLDASTVTHRDGPYRPRAERLIQAMSWRRVAGRRRSCFARSQRDQRLRLLHRSGDRIDNRRRDARARLVRESRKRRTGEDDDRRPSTRR